VIAALDAGSDRRGGHDRRAIIFGGRRAEDPRASAIRRPIEALPITGRQRAGDIVVYNVARGGYVIRKLGGQRIGISRDRRDAMCQACAAARASGGYVWIAVDEKSNVYHEVLCP
jgi:hypothetical protein